jgi:beta-galactosidase
VFRYGVDYYPEQWPEERWAEDARLMQAAQINVVRLAEFAWAKLEPSDGQFDFAWLDRAVDLLAQHGIQTVLGTPTASPPAWLMATYPDTYLVNDAGVAATYGARREYCPTNTTYRRYSVQIVEAMAQHFHDNPHVIGWQIDNEFGDRCYCPACHSAFQRWLRSKYSTLDQLNARWGTIFWSHTYTDWSQIPLPLKTAHTWNPGLALDYYRFMSETYREYQQLQIDVIRLHCPQHFITHNLMGFSYPNLNYFDLAAPLDFVSWDNYPRGFWNRQPEVRPSGPALGHDTMRSLKHRSFWVMEAQSGHAGWEYLGLTPRPGEIRLWAYQGIAHGADGLVFFRWRSARYGTEQYWQGILDHDGSPRRRYAEIKQMGEELKRIGHQLVGASTRAQVAMLTSYDTRFAFQIQPNHPDFSYPEHFARYYNALHRRNLAVELVSPDDDLSSYQLLLVPALYLVNETLVSKFRAFAEKGGTIVFTARAGVKDDFNAVVDKPLPGLLTDLCGIEVEEYDALADTMIHPLQFDMGLVTDGCGSATLWCDVLHLTTAQVAASYTQDYYAGKPAIALNRVGPGQVIYVGSFGDDALAQTVVNWALSLADICSPLDTPSGVEVMERWQGDNHLLFVLNHRAEPQTITLDAVYTDILGGVPVSGAITVKPRDVVILSS